ncbi:MAG TPA: isocitrate lyase/PEP mutase family protein [Burkholderiales bacterium]|jgi:2-methylisocitrate lyase-like PEP mutase family enzyme|nr:isocitrate lyase/PEP mutase family protein [Burkholderiales bacterium]
MKPTTTLRNLLARPGALMAPGVADALNARLVRKHGFEALYMTGAGTSAVRLGMPDVGLLTMTEMVDNAARIAEAAGLPLIADADNGYGGVLNVRRTVQAYERAGAAAVHIEDQVLPKRCGHLAGKQLVPVEEMEAKIRAAVDARADGDFVLIARTDAIAVEGFEPALERAARYREAGADVLFVEAPSAEQLPKIAPRLEAPLLYNMATSGKTPFLGRAEIERLGFKLIIYPNWMMLAAIRAASEVLAELKQTGSIANVAREVPSFREFFDLLGMPEVQELEARYGVADSARAKY